MHAIILAAGRGRRLAPMGWTRPKCLLEIAGTTLLDRMLSALAAQDIRDVTLVVGHQHADVESVAIRHPLRLRFLMNDRYETTNTVYSLWLAREAMRDDFLYFNADVLFSTDILTRLLAQDGSALAIDEKRCGEEEVKVITAPSGRVRRIGKNLDPGACTGEFIGVARFDKTIGPDFAAVLHDINVHRKQEQAFFEEALDELLDRHIVRAVPTGGAPAIEIDTPEDYQRACDLARLGAFT